MATLLSGQDRNQMSANATHPLIANLCVEMAQEAYELTAKGNTFYKLYPNRNAYVSSVAPTLRKQATLILSEMLGHHDVSDDDKARIYEALLLDRETPNPHTWEVPNLNTAQWMK